MKRLYISSEERLLSQIIQHVTEVTKCFKLWVYLDTTDKNGGFIVTEENPKLFPLCELKRKELLKAISDLEKRDWISIQREPDLKGIFTLFINFLPNIYGHQNKKAQV
jgi:hypothetical protein